jgi:maleylacetoacetate isomerase
MKLYTFWRSLATYRVRMALALKGIDVETTTVDLMAGHQRDPSYHAVNPQMVIPALVADDGTVLTQSLAILEYLDETHPNPPLMPKDAMGRARVRALSLITVADAHPLVGPRVREHLGEAFGATEDQKLAWGRHWLMAALEAYETALSRSPATGTYAHGDSLTIADLCLASHCVGVALFGGSLEGAPTVKRIFERTIADPRIAAAHPLKQPGAPQPAK